MTYDTVATLADLLRIDAISMRLPKLTVIEVHALKGVPPQKQPWSRHWTNRFVFTLQSGIVADHDVIYPALGGGHWVRIRDIS